MKQAILLLLLVTGYTATAQTKDKQQIRAKLDEQVLAWNKGNIDDFMKAYWQSDSLMFIAGNGITYGHKATLEGYYKRYPDTDAMGQLTFTILKVNRISSDSYFVTGRWFLKREKKGDVGGYFTLLWKKINNEWVIVADHTS
ncbi:nuclear transport factor 2 family protein [Lacibacter sp. MH-610]|uniref:YybH family protein n=1 Tax=Lacibacter sp. MH-610 TaxID=3020883 RepID=UPI003891753D